MAGSRPSRPSRLVTHGLGRGCDLIGEHHPQPGDLLIREWRCFVARCLSDIENVGGRLAAAPARACSCGGLRGFEVAGTDGGPCGLGQGGGEDVGDAGGDVALPAFPLAYVFVCAHFEADLLVGGVKDGGQADLVGLAQRAEHGPVVTGARRGSSRKHTHIGTQLCASCRPLVANGSHHVGCGATVGLMTGTVTGPLPWAEHAARGAPLPELAHICAYSSRVEWTPAEIRRRRHDRGLSQEELAGSLGVSRSIINKWELGERHPGGASIRKLDRELLGDTLSDSPLLSQATDAQLVAELMQLVSELARRLAEGRSEPPAPHLPDRDLEWPRRTPNHNSGNEPHPGHVDSGGA